MTDTGVSQQQLEVILLQRQHRTVDNIDDAQHGKRNCPGLGLLREQKHSEADQPVSSHFQQNPRVDHDNGRRSLGMHLQHPGMEREDRQLDPEGDQYQQEQHMTAADGPGPSLAQVDGPLQRIL
ncbi:hypothetical protein D3C76_1399250 [compost metagenome]